MGGGYDRAPNHKYGGNILCLDRGYQSRSICDELAQFGVNLCGTVKKGGGHCHTFGSSKVQKGQISIAEKGALMANWQTRSIQARLDTNLMRDKVVRNMFAVGLRSGLGRVCLMQTTLESLSRGNWTIVPFENMSTPKFYNSEAYAEFRNKVQFLTQRQGTADWHILRKFRFTSSVIGKVVKVISRHNDHIPSPAFQRTQRYLGIKQATTQPFVDIDGEAQAHTSDDELIEPMSRTQFEAHVTTGLYKTKTQLTELVRIHNATAVAGRKIGSIGNKSVDEVRQLVKNGMTPEEFQNAVDILQKRNEVAIGAEEATESAKKIEDIILAASFMAPVRTAGMAIGSKNEGEVLKKIIPHIKKFGFGSIEFLDTEVQQCGLLHLKDRQYLATSLDGVIKVI